MQGLRALASTTAFKWTLAIAAGFTGMALLLFSFIYWQTAVYARERIDGLITREARYIADLPVPQALPALRFWVGNDLHAVRYSGLFSTAGGHVGGNLLDQPAPLPEDGRAHWAVFSHIDRDHDGDAPEVVRAVAMRLANGELLVVGYDVDELEDVKDIILRALGLGMVPTIILSLVGGVALARRAQRRIASVREAIGRIMQGQLGERLPMRGNGDDMDRLATAVNGMLQEIERLVGEIRSVGDNIAHDLRTPLTRVRARLERARDEARTREAFQHCIDRAMASVDRALSVVSAILRISEIEHSRRRAEFSVLDLSAMALDAVELYEPLADEDEITLRLDAVPGMLAFGDRDLLLEATGNLLDNALKFAPRGSEVTLSVWTTADEVRLRVMDRGPGIPVSERQSVLRRSYRGEKSRTMHGNGLGLSLVAAIVSLHGFALTIDDAQPGCCVTIACPAWRHEAVGHEAPALPHETFGLLTRHLGF